MGRGVANLRQLNRWMNYDNQLKQFSTPHFAKSPGCMRLHPQDSRPQVEVKEASVSHMF